MSNLEPHLRNWVDKYKKDIVDDTLRYIDKDAPKTKFTILTGKMKAMEDLLSEIDSYNRESKKS